MTSRCDAMPLRWPHLQAKLGHRLAGLLFCVSNRCDANAPICCTLPALYMLCSSRLGLACATNGSALVSPIMAVLSRCRALLCCRRLRHYDAVAVLDVSPLRKAWALPLKALAKPLISLLFQLIALLVVTTPWRCYACPRDCRAIRSTPLHAKA